MSFFDDFDWKAALKTIAPTVAGLIAAPLGMAPLANAGVRALLDAAFPEEDHTSLSPPEMEQKLSTAIAGGQLTPDQIAAMHKADLDYQQRIAELGLDGMKVDAADRDSARKREMAVKDHVPAALAAITVVGFFVTLWALFRYIPPEQNRDIVYLLIGQGVTATFMMVYNYYFGSSEGSRIKDRTAAAVAKISGAVNMGGA